MSHKKEVHLPLGDVVGNWRPAKRPNRKPLKGRYGSLEPLDIRAHGEMLFKNLCMDNMPESWTYLPYGPFTRKEEFYTCFKTIDSEPDTELYTILCPKGQPLGIAGYSRIDPEHGVIEVGHLSYSLLLRGTTTATEAMYLMMQNIFEVLGYRRYEWKCNSLNHASQVCALRLGFQREGVFRQSNVFKNRNRDTAWFSILDKEWPALKIKFNQWLEPSNFDSQGNQIRRLQDI